MSKPKAAPMLVFESDPLTPHKILTEVHDAFVHAHRRDVLRSTVSFEFFTIDPDTTVVYVIDKHTVYDPREKKAGWDHVIPMRKKPEKN